jgi:hypothetical protein
MQKKSKIKYSQLSMYGDVSYSIKIIIQIYENDEFISEVD